MEVNCTVHRVLFYIEGCIDDQELAGVMLGVFSAALWSLVHISFYTHQRRNMKLNRHVVSSITAHMVADGLSCAGAILAQQKSLQVIFALFGTVVNASIGLHCWCSTTTHSNGSAGKEQVRKPVSDRYHCLCSVVFLSLCLLFITMCVTEYLTISDDYFIYRSSNQLQPHIHTIITVGYILGGVGTLSYWFSKLYEVVESYRKSSHRGAHTCMYLTAITGDTTYLLGIYIQTATFVYVVQTLPWTLARMGLIGIHMGIIFQSSCIPKTKEGNDNVRLLKQTGKSNESDWSDDSSTVICGACDLQTSVHQMICTDSHDADNTTICELKESNKIYKKDTDINVESASSESPELEWDFEWLSDTKRRQFTKMEVNKLTPYDGYYKVVEWFKKTCDNDCSSDIDDFKDNTCNDSSQSQKLQCIQQIN